MKALWDHWPEALGRRMGERGLLLLLDFDGTLSPIAERPGDARISASVRRLLVRLNGRPRVKVGVISGRALADVKRRVGVPALFYGGNHGLEIEGPGFRFRHPRGLRLRPALKKIGVECAAALRGVPGVLVEDKGLGIAVHYRSVPPGRRADFWRRLKGIMEGSRRLSVLWGKGKCVREALPRVPWNKGKAARLLRAHLGGPVLFAVGDDATDEELFRAVDGSGVSVRVAPRGRSRARYMVRRQAEVPRLLKKLDELARP